MPVDIVNAPELIRNLLEAETGTIIIDSRTRLDYLRGHIPGAVHMAWESWCEPPPSTCRPLLRNPGYWGSLADPHEAGFARRLEAAGVSSDAPIVVYSDGPTSRGREGRIAWMLLYLGARQVSLLNGGLGSWKSAGGGLEKGDRQPSRRGRFIVSLDERRRTRLDDLAQAYAAGSLPLLVDTRTPSEFAGDCFFYQPRTGRLPGSVLLPFASLFDGDGFYVDVARYLQVIPAELQSSGRAVAYCEVGVRAGVFALLHEHYTGTILPVFDGSIMEWSFQAHLPVLTG